MKKVIGTLKCPGNVVAKIVESKFGSTEIDPCCDQSSRDLAAQYVYYFFHDKSTREEELWYYQHTEKEACQKEAYDDWDTDMRRNV
jgi:hypothetical protein